MKVTVATLNHEIFVVGVNQDMELENFIALCESESGVPANEIVISFKGQPLMDPNKTLYDHGIRDRDSVILERFYRMDIVDQKPFNGTNPFTGRIPSPAAKI